MKRSGYGAFLIDLDGTLIGRTEQISPRVADAVLSVIGKMKVSLVSGREPADVIRFARQLGLTTPQVSDNGALVLDPATGASLWNKPLPPEIARNVVGALADEGIPFIATHPGGTEKRADQITTWELTRISGLDMREEDADELVGRFETEPGLHVVKASLPYNGLWAADFTCAGVNKASAVGILVDMLEVQPEHLIAVGDSYNDLPMLKACGLRIVMGDAPAELKSIADYVAPSVDDDGLAVAIEDFVLPRL